MAFNYSRMLRSSWPVLIMISLASAKQAPPGTEVKAAANPVEATVGDPIQINLDFRLPPGCRVLFPKLPGTLDEFTILEAIPGPDVPGQPPAETKGPPSKPQEPTSETHHRARIVAALFKPGEFDFPSLSFKIRDSGGNEFDVSSPAVHVRIVSVLKADDLNLRDLKGQAEIREPVRWFLWAVLGAGALLLGFLGWWMLRRRRRVQSRPLPAHPRLDPLDRAEADLRALLGLGLPEKGQTKQFYVRLSEIIRAALDATYDLETLEKTTAEIVVALAYPPEGAAARAEASSLEKIEIFLLSCDLVKFARYVPPPAEREESVQQAFRVLEDCRMARRASALTSAPVSEGS